MENDNSKVFYYLLAMFLYRFMYIFNWAYRFYFEGYYDNIAIFGGIVQCMTYSLLFFKTRSTQFSNSEDELGVKTKKESTSLIFNYLSSIKIEENIKISKFGSDSLYETYKKQTEETNMDEEKILLEPSSNNDIQSLS